MNIGTVEANNNRAMLAVIQCYKENKCLWDENDPKHRNRETRNKAYKSVLQLYRKIEPTASLSDLKKKITNMRTTYKKELRKVRSSCLYTNGNEVAYVPKLWYYEHLLFLDEEDVNITGQEELDEESSDNRDIQQNSKASNEDNIDVLSQQPSQEKGQAQYQNPVTTSTDMQKDNMSLKEQQESALNNANTTLTPKEHEWDIIGKSIGLQLKNLDSYQQDFAQKLISDIIFYGKRRKLNDSTTILLEPHHPSHLRTAQYSNLVASNNWNSTVPSLQSLRYSSQAPSLPKPSSFTISSQLDDRFLSTTSHQFPQQLGTQLAPFPLATRFHHTCVEQPQMSTEVTAPPGIKQEEIIISDNEGFDDYVSSYS